MSIFLETSAKMECVNDCFIPLRISCETGGAAAGRRGRRRFRCKRGTKQTKVAVLLRRSVIHMFILRFYHYIERSREREGIYSRR